MDVFVGEFVTGGGLLQKADNDSPRSFPEVSSSLQTEGMAMLRALLEDFAGVCRRVHTVIDPRLSVWVDDYLSFAAPDVKNRLVFHYARPGAPLWPQWITAAKDCDAALVVAPESGNILAQGVATLQAAGLDMLNGFGDFLRCASDKLETARLLAAAGIPHPTTWPLESVPWDQLPRERSRWVRKPRDGCGTENIEICDSIEALQALPSMPGTLIQKWVEGMAASVAIIIEGSEVTVLPAVRQKFTPLPLTYVGGVGPLEENARQRAHHLALKTVRAMPRSVRGFVGLDLVLGATASEDHVIEVNPRLTTSYVGLRSIVDGNLAARLLGIDRSPLILKANSNQVHWDAKGNVRITP